MRSDRAASEANGESGFILIVVLWVLAALAALASTYLVYVDNAAFATQLNDDRLRIRNAISTGIELTAYKLLAAPKDKDARPDKDKDKDARPPQGAFTLRLSRSTINVTFVSESARVDLNAAPKGLLAGLFTGVGVSPSNAATFADRIVGWRTKAAGANQNNADQDNAGQENAGQNNAGQNNAGQDNAGQMNAGQNNTGQNNASQNNASQNNVGQNNAGQNSAGQNNAGQNSGDQNNTDQNKEAQAYKEAGYAYAPRQAPFQNVLELPLVLGIPPYIVERVLPLVTVYSGSAQIDVRVASPEVLSALPNVTPEELQKVLAQRAHDPLDGESLLKLLGSARAAANASPNSAARVKMQIRLDNGRVARAEVVILVLQGEDEPYRVLSWRDDSDGSI
jgi:type II secretory pathway component PulK